MGEWTLLLSRWIEIATYPAPATIRRAAAMPVGVLKKERLSVDPDVVVVEPPACAMRARDVGLSLATLAAALAARPEDAGTLAAPSPAEASGAAQEEDAVRFAARPSRGARRMAPLLADRVRDHGRARGRRRPRGPLARASAALRGGGPSPPRPPGPERTVQRRGRHPRHHAGRPARLLRVHGRGDAEPRRPLPRRRRL